LTSTAILALSPAEVYLSVKVLGARTQPASNARGLVRHGVTKGLVCAASCQPSCASSQSYQAACRFAINCRPSSSTTFLLLSPCMRMA